MELVDCELEKVGDSNVHYLMNIPKDHFAREKKIKK